MEPQISLFSNFFIKNGSHGTIHIFKNYFATVFFSFQLYPNGPYISFLVIKKKLGETCLRKENLRETMRTCVESKRTKQLYQKERRKQEGF